MAQPVDQHSVRENKWKPAHIRQENLTTAHKTTDYKGDGKLNNIAGAFMKFYSLKFESLNQLNIWEHYLENPFNPTSSQTQEILPVFLKHQLQGYIEFYP